MVWHGSGWLWSVAEPEASEAWGASSSTAASPSSVLSPRARRLSYHSSSSGLTFREALCLPQEQELSLPH